MLIDDIISAILHIFRVVCCRKAGELCKVFFFAVKIRIPQIYNIYRL